MWFAALKRRIQCTRWNVRKIGHMHTILLIDDDSCARETHARLLAMSGMASETAATGRLGVAMARSLTFDLVLIDLRLPDISGIQVAEQMRSHGISCPLVVMTAFPDIQSSFRAGAAGAYGYIEGPVTSEELISLIRNALASVQNHSQQYSPPRTHDRLHEDARIAAVRTALDTDVSLPLATLAAQVNLSVSRLRHLFAATTGTSLSHYRHIQRMNAASLLLRETHLRVSEIAYRVGLEPASLDRAYRKYCGESPTEYRTRQQGDPYTPLTIGRDKK